MEKKLKVIFSLLFIASAFLCLSNIDITDNINPLCFDTYKELGFDTSYHSPEQFELINTQKINYRNNHC